MSLGGVCGVGFYYVWHQFVFEGMECTIDKEKLEKDIKTCKIKKEMYLPFYDRQLHEPVKNKIPVLEK